MNHSVPRPRGLVYSFALVVVAVLVVWCCCSSCSTALFVSSTSDADANENTIVIGISDESDAENEKQNNPTASSSSSTSTATYGVDVSFPMTRHRIDDHDHDDDKNKNKNNILGSQYRQALYDELMEGCAKAYDREHCQNSEAQRISRNARRPALLYNYTQLGFAKIKAPAPLWNILQTFWQQNNGAPPNNENNNNNNNNENNSNNKNPIMKNWQLEQWEYGSSTVNHWEAPSYVVSLHNASLMGGGKQLEQAVWDATKATLEAWTGQRLQGCSLYGVRIYTTNSILHTHVDRVPLIASAILNIAQDTDEPWPLEVIGHDGMAHNITMVPGDMVLYESHSILHGRPFALKGRYMANVFVHFEVLPSTSSTSSTSTSSTSNHGKKLPYVNYDLLTPEDLQKIQKEYNDHHHQQQQQQQQHLRRNIRPSSSSSSNNIAVDLRPHYLAGNGKLKELQDLVLQVQQQQQQQQQDNDNGKNLVSSLLFAPDPQGWQPIHEAARNGHIPVIHYLLEQQQQQQQQDEGADNILHALTHAGASARSIAEQYQGADSLVVRYLQSKEQQGAAAGGGGGGAGGGQVVVPKQQQQQQQQQQQALLLSSPTLPHQLAGDGELSKLKQLAQQIQQQHADDPNKNDVSSSLSSSLLSLSLFHQEDANGWTPLHEAARGGHVHVVEYLVSPPVGAPLNGQTKTGATPLYTAARFHGTESLVYQKLKELGGIYLGPE